VDTADRASYLSADDDEREADVTATATSEYRQFIGGEWVDAADGETFEDRDPFTGDVVATVAAGRGRGAAITAGRTVAVHAPASSAHVTSTYRHRPTRRYDQNGAHETRTPK